MFPCHSFSWRRRAHLVDLWALQMRQYNGHCTGPWELIWECIWLEEAWIIYYIYGLLFMRGDGHIIPLWIKTNKVGQSTRRGLVVWQPSDHSSNHQVSVITDIGEYFLSTESKLCGLPHENRPNVPKMHFLCPEHSCSVHSFPTKLHIVMT